MSAVEEIEDTKLDELVKVYLTIRSAREKMKAEWEVEDRALEDEMKVLEQNFMVTCNESNAKSIRTNNGTVIRKLNERFTVADGESFRKFVLENEAVDLLEARIHQGNFKEFIKERAADGLPPGVNVMREFTITVRKPSN
jgi:hypothetical protein